MATIKRVQGNRLELAIPLQTETMTPSGKVVADYNVPEGAEVRVLLVSAWKKLAFVPTSVSGNLVTVVDNGTLPTGKYAVEVRIKEADGTPLRSKYCNIIEVCDCNDGVTTQYDDFIEGSVQLDAQVFYYAKGDKGDDGITPHIDEETGNWFVGDTDTGVHAQGEAGTTDYNDLENKPDLSIYVEKDGDKVLSDNNYTDEEKTLVHSALQSETDPTVPSWAKQPTKPSYTAQEVGALPDTTKYGYSLDVSLNTSDYKLTISLKDQDGTLLNSKVVDFPIESVVVSGAYDNDTKKIILTLQGGSTIDVPVGDLVSGLQSEITALNMLDADLVDDTNSEHKFVSQQEKQSWSSKYQKPTNGIPKTDLAQDVKDSLDKADSALQEDTLYEDANGHDYVEIAGMKWATMNVGADTVTDYGNYYQYGKGARTYDETYEEQPYDGEESPLDIELDAARQTLGGTWRIPTMDEYQTLLLKTTYAWVENYNGSGINGFKFTDNEDNTKYLFIPAAGVQKQIRDIVGVGKEDIVIRSSIPSGSSEVFALYIDDEGRNEGKFNRVYGCIIRPVLGGTKLKEDLDSKVNDADLATVAKSGSYNDLTDKPTIPTVPTNVSAFTNDAGYITKSVNDLVNYYLKSEVYTKTEVANLIAAIQQFHYEIYASISAVTSPAGNVLYLIGPTGTGSDKYEEYVYDPTKQEPWVKIGDTSIDLSDYYTKGQTDSAITQALNAALANYTTTEALRLLLAGKQDVINDLSDIRSGARAGATAYQKPQGGIPSTDMSQAVQTSLGKADSSLQPSQQTLTDQQKQQARNNIGAAGVDDVPTLPNNVSYFSGDSGDGIVPDNGIRGEGIIASSAISVNPDVVTAITGEIGSATTITLVVPNDNLRHVWDMFFTTASDGGATIVVPQGATLHVPAGYSIASGKTYEVRIIGVGNHYYLTCQEYN